MMPSRSWPVCALACWLTLAASGDDFCLPRLLLSCARPATSRLPLDDPNTDFVPVAESGNAAASAKAPCDRADVPAAWDAGLTPPAAVGADPAAVRGSADRRHFPPGPPDIPLRC